MERTKQEFVQQAEETLISMQLPCTPLEYVCKTCLPCDRPDGLWLEFGTGTGTTASLMSSYRMNGTIYTFDRAKNLSEDWRQLVTKGNTIMLLPENLPENVSLIEGRLEDTLELFMKEHTEPVDLVHIHCDDYASTQAVLSQITGNIHSGSVMVFDQLLFYEGCENYEAGALYDWLQKTDYRINWVGIQGSQRVSDLAEQVKENAGFKQTLNQLGSGNTRLSSEIPMIERVALQVSCTKYTDQVL